MYNRTWCPAAREEVLQYQVEEAEFDQLGSPPSRVDEGLEAYVPASVHRAFNGDDEARLLECLAQFGS